MLVRILGSVLIILTFTSCKEVIVEPDEVAEVQYFEGFEGTFGGADLVIHDTNTIYEDSIYSTNILQLPPDSSQAIYLYKIENKTTSEKLVFGNGIHYFRGDRPQSDDFFSFMKTSPKDTIKFAELTTNRDTINIEKEGFFLSYTDPNGLFWSSGLGVQNPTNEFTIEKFEEKVSAQSRNIFFYNIDVKATLFASTGQKKEIEGKLQGRWTYTLDE